MKRFVANVRWLVALATIASLLTSQSGCDTLSLDDPATVARNSKRALTVNAIEIKKVDSTIETVTYFGRLEPNRQAYLGFRAGGSIATLAVVGERFGRGEVLATLDSTDLEQQKRSIEQRLELATSNGQAAQIQSLNSELAGIASKIAENQITAPFDCVVDEVMSFDGGLVNGQKPVLKVVESAQPNVMISLPQKVARWINDQQLYNFVIGDGAKQGKLLRQNVTEDPVGSVTMWFQLLDLEGITASFGSIVECRFNLSKDQSGYWLPMDAVTGNGQGIWAVLVVAPNSEGTGQIEKRMVQVRRIDQQRVLIDGPLQDGDLVVANGLHRIVVGQTVTVNPIRLESAVARNPGSMP